MRAAWVWSISLGRWFGVHLRVHLLFVLLVIFGAYVHSQHPEMSRPMDAATPHVNVVSFHALAFAIVLFLSVLSHELGHVLVAKRLGGNADDLVIGPAGGMVPVRVAFEPHAELVANLAGVLVNAGICLLAASMLALFQQQQWDAVDLRALLSPLTLDFTSSAESVFVRGWVSSLKLVFWVNWSLLLINLIPAFPFDGGYVLRSVMGFFWPDVDGRQTTLIIARLGKLIAVGLLLGACFALSPEPAHTQPLPIWLICVLTATYLLFCAQGEEFQPHERQNSEDTVFGYDFSQGYTSLERSLDADSGDRTPQPANSPLGMIGDWIEQRRAAQRERERQEEQEDERRVDEILARLHEDGLNNLSPADRALLDRVSKRYRSRQQ